MQEVSNSMARKCMIACIKQPTSFLYSTKTCPFFYNYFLIYLCHLLLLSKSHNNPITTFNRTAAAAAAVQIQNPIISLRNPLASLSSMAAEKNTTRRLVLLLSHPFLILCLRLSHSL